MGAHGANLLLYFRGLLSESKERVGWGGGVDEGVQIVLSVFLQKSIF